MNQYKTAIKKCNKEIKSYRKVRKGINMTWEAIVKNQYCYLNIKKLFCILGVSITFSLTERLAVWMCRCARGNFNKLIH